MLKSNINVKHIEENIQVKSKNLLNTRQQMRFKLISNTTPQNKIPEYINYSSISKIYIFSKNYSIILARTFELYFTSLNIEVKIFDALTDNLINECISDPSLYLFFITLQAFLVNFRMNLPKYLSLIHI